MNPQSRRGLLLPHRDQANKAHVLLINSIAMWLAGFMTTGINIALPPIQKEFNLGPVALGWLPLAYLVATGALVLPFGKIADLFGRRRIFLVGLGLFAVSSLGLFISPAYAGLVAFRASQGVGSALMFASSIAMITLAYPPGQRGRAMGIYSGVIYLGHTMGPSVGGVIVHNLGWRSLFLIVGITACVTVALDLWLLGDTEWKEQKATGFDWKGSVVYALALAAFLLGLSWLPTIPAVVLVVCGLAGVALFVRRQARVDNPVLEVGLFRHNRLFAFSNAAALINYAAVWAMTFLMSLYLQFVKGLNAETAGLVLVAGVAVQASLSPLVGRLADRLEPRWLASSGMGLCVLALLSFSFLHAGTPYWYIIATLCVLGLGFAFFSTPNQNSIMSSVAKQHVGVASASLSTMRMVGQGISIGIATLVLAVIVGRHDIRPADYPNLLISVRVTFAVLTAMCLVGVVASLSRGGGSARAGTKAGGPEPESAGYAPAVDG
jgi:EmrB/QacA subfamily drug resistance transporter